MNTKLIMTPTAAYVITMTELALAPLQGTASLSAPLVGARISILDRRGRLVESFGNATDAYGRYAVVIASTLTDFTVVASGGTLDGHDFEGSLRATVRGHRAGLDTVELGAITTITSLYQHAHPRMSLAACEATVLRFLGFSSKHEARARFSPSVFLARAARAGDFDAYCAFLAHGVDVYSHSPEFSECNSERAAVAS